MRVFFGTLIIMISQLSCDFGMYLYDLSAELWENLYVVFKRMLIFVGVVVTLLFDAWIFWMLFNWAEHPLALTLIIMGAIVVIFFQVGAWIHRGNIYKWFLNEWSRASHTYRHRRTEAQIVKKHNDQISAVDILDKTSL